MGVAGVADLLVPAADMVQVRRRACEQPVAEVDHGAGVTGWRPVDHARVKPSCDWGVRRAGDSYRVSRHLQAAAQTMSKTIILPTAAQCALPRSLA
jgi:hypothetical protein